MKQFNLEEYLANPSKKVVTRDGRNVKIHCTNYYLGNQCVIAEIEDIDRSFSFNQYGQQYGNTEDSPLNLFFEEEKHEGWINIYRSLVYNEAYSGKIYASKEEAERYTNNATLATAKIEWEEDICQR